MTLPTDLPVLAFADRAALEEWLDAEHATAPGLYVRLAKKGSGVPSVTYAELVESVLRFGWIDGRWERAHAGPATITVPDDLAAALAADPAAQHAFAGLDGRNRYAQEDPPAPHHSQARGGTLQEGRRPY